jgi:hypothetical protein
VPAFEELDVKLFDPTRPIGCKTQWVNISVHRQETQPVVPGVDQDRDKGGLNSEDLGLELKINGDLRLRNCDLVKK